MGYAEQHMRESIQIIEKMDVAPIEKMADLLAQVKADGGRIFFLGVGGSAGNCSHAVNDFRKIVGIESYAPTDNVSELTARTNDEGWATIFVEWLKTSRLTAKDAIFVFSVGGGNLEKNISPNLVEALKYAKTIGSAITGVVGRDGGYTAQVADVCLIVPVVNADTITPHSEAFQAVVWHLLVSHPRLKANQTKWESAVRWFRAPRFSTPTAGSTSRMVAPARLTRTRNSINVRAPPPCREPCHGSRPTGMPCTRV